MEIDRRGYPPASGSQDSPSIVGNAYIRPTANWQLRKLSPPPKLDTKQLEGWPREIKFWRDLYRRIDDDQILARIGLNGSEETKDILIDFMEDNREIPSGRTFSRF